MRFDPPSADETVVVGKIEKKDAAKDVLPDDPTVADITLPRASSGHTAELGRLRNQVAKLLDRVQQLEEGGTPTTVVTPVEKPPAPAKPRPRPNPSAGPAPAPPATPWKKPPPATATPARPGAGPSTPARPGPPTPARPGGAAPSTPAKPSGGPAKPPRPAGGAPSTPPRPSGRSAAPPRPGNAPVIPARPASTPARPHAAPAKPARSSPPVPRPASPPPPAKAPRPDAKAAATPATPAADGDLAAGYAAVLADVLGVPKVADTSNFFDDLGADSLVMARFCAKVRAKPDLPNVAIKDVYRAPTIAELAAVGAKAATRTPVSATDTVTIKLAAIRKTDVVVVENDPAMAPVATPTYLLCGLLQLLVLLGYPALVAYAFATGAEWVLAALTPLDVYVRAVVFTGAMFLGTALLPILVKWLLVGRWKPTQFPVYGLRYFRFWLVKTLVRTNPLVRFVGTPLYPIYLRMLGARIGKGATILSPTVPVCTDMLTVGAKSVIRKSSSFTGYRAHAGMIQTGPVTIGSAALVGEATVLDVFTSVGDGAQLGHTSSLHAGQSVPDGKRWHGNPAEPTTVNYRAVQPVKGGGLRKAVYAIVQVVMLFGVVLPMGTAGIVLLVKEVPAIQQLFVSLEAVDDGLPPAVDALIIGSFWLFGGILGGLVVMTTVPRLLALFVRPNKVHRTYGISYWALRSVTRLTNSPFLTRVTGDSSFVVGYLRAIGYRFDRVEQTGSNFGTVVNHDSPFLCHVGSGTVVADGLTFVNADYSNNAFMVSTAKIGAHSFLGNGIFYPSRSRVGDDCLLATKVMVPIDGPLRHGIGLLGSPSFPIPRSTDRDARLGVTPEQRRRGVKAKDRHNAVSIVLLLLSRWVYLTLVVLLARYALDFYPRFGAVTIAALAVAQLLFTFAYFVTLDRVVRGLVALRPQGVSIYDRGFWRHERYWKVAADVYIQSLNGTPFKAGLWRALGVKVGRRLFDDGLGMTERSLVTIGDHCSMNERSLIQCHSQENDAFKSDRVVVGSGVTVGVSAFIHYGTRLGDGSLIEADSFLVKGEETEPFTRWGGNPAAELGSAPQLPITSRRKS
ncbi:Pls/PosA family non-ribosomal peptide synthetase [Actinomycetes bacterium KLBMP 9759]